MRPWPTRRFVPSGATNAEKNVRKRIYWFTGRSKAHYCLAWCPEHGYIRGKIRFKNTDDHKHVYVVKTLRLIDEDEAMKIREMKEDIVQKRREKRHRDSSPDAKSE